MEEPGITLREHVCQQMTERDRRHEQAIAHLERIISDQDHRFQQLLAERDQRYEQRAQAQQTALQRVEEQTRTDKAAANEWRAALTDSYARYASKESQDMLGEKIADLTAWRRGQEQFREGATTTRGQTMGTAALWATILGIVVAAIGTFLLS